MNTRAKLVNENLNEFVGEKPEIDMETLTKLIGSAEEDDEIEKIENEFSIASVDSAGGGDVFWISFKDHEWTIDEEIADIQEDLWDLDPNFEPEMSMPIVWKWIDKVAKSWGAKYVWFFGDQTLTSLDTGEQWEYHYPDKAFKVIPAAPENDYDLSPYEDYINNLPIPE